MTKEQRIETKMFEFAAEYARETAIGFVNWLNKQENERFKKYLQAKDIIELESLLPYEKITTTEQLYNKYIESLK